MDSDGDERCVLDLSGESVADLVHLGPALEAFHAAQPALDVRISRVAATDEITHSNYLHAAVIRQGHFVAAKKRLLRAEQMLVEDRQPTLRFLLSPGHHPVLNFVAGSLVMGEQLRIDQSVA